MFVARFRNWNPLPEGAPLSPSEIKAVFVEGLIVTPQLAQVPPEKAVVPLAPLVKVFVRVEPEMR